nr:hypothetical protein BaRGS_007689 [Batillaria attramentaria]
MIAHLPMNTHPSPQKVLVVGGGDGGVVREVLKYDTVKEVILCEIDEKVVEVCRKYLPIMAGCLDDPRVTVHIGDGVAYVKNRPDEFDVIITDSPSTDAESTWFDLPVIKQMLTDCRSLFPLVGYAIGHVPTYVGGQNGYLVCGTDPALAEVLNP